MLMRRKYANDLQQFNKKLRDYHQFYSEKQLNERVSREHSKVLLLISQGLFYF
mgnify:CR=1 FL=1